MIYEDFERESQKDLVYLQEVKMQMEQEFWAEMNKKSANILIINETSNPTENEQSNILPFRENA
jgi:hypothetical protein